MVVIVMVKRIKTGDKGRIQALAILLDRNRLMRFGDCMAGDDIEKWLGLF